MITFKNHFQKYKYRCFKKFYKIEALATWQHTVNHETEEKTRTYVAPVVKGRWERNLRRRGHCCHPLSLSYQLAVEIFLNLYSKLALLLPLWCLMKPLSQHPLYKETHPLPPEKVLLGQEFLFQLIVIGPFLPDKITFKACQVGTSPSLFTWPNSAWDGIG